MNDKVPVFVICVEASIHLLLYDLHDSTFNHFYFLNFYYFTATCCWRFKRFQIIQSNKKGLLVDYDNIRYYGCVTALQLLRGRDSFMSKNLIRRYGKLV